MAKKVGYYDLDPDVLNDIMKQAASGSVSYDDRPVKQKIKELQTLLNDLNTNGARNSFNKYLDKVTIDMLSENLRNKIDKALAAVDGSGADQQLINADFNERFNTLNQACNQEAQDRSSADDAHDKKLTDLETMVNELKVVINEARDMLSDLKNASFQVMTGASETSPGKEGVVPMPSAGQQDCILSGGAQWVRLGDIAIQNAENDKNGTPITEYISSVSFDEQDKEFTFVKGNGTEIRFSLIEQESSEEENT